MLYHIGQEVFKFIIPKVYHSCNLVFHDVFSHNYLRILLTWPVSK